MGAVLTKALWLVLYHEALLCDVAGRGRGSPPLKGPDERESCIWMSGTFIIGHYMGAQFPQERISGDQVTSITPFGHAAGRERGCVGSSH